MLTRRILLVACVVTATALAVPAARAGNLDTPYTEAAFDAAQKGGQPILIDTFANWCDICARQKPILEKLVQLPKFKDLVVLRVDFDKQKDVMRKFKAPVQSTLIVFRGDKELGRSTGETQPEWIEDLLDKVATKGTT